MIAYHFSCSVRAASCPNPRVIWKRTTLAIQVRLRMGTEKTANVLQQCKLARAIVIPEITYVARHVWPSATIMYSLQRGIHNLCGVGISRPRR